MAESGDQNEAVVRLTDEQRERIEAVLERIEREIAELRAGTHPEMRR